MTMHKTWRRVFLDAYRNSGNVRASCQAAGVGRTAVYTARLRDPKFAAAWDEAREEAIDTLEAAAWQRARESSDYLLWRLLQANRRAMYGDPQPQVLVDQRQVNLNGGPIPVAVMQYLGTLTPEQLAQLAGE